MVEGGGDGTVSANRERPHLQVILEDDANRQIAVGFRNHPNVNSRQMPLDNVAGGWIDALRRFSVDEIPMLRRYPHRQVLIVIDFDGNKDRFNEALSYIPEDLRERVYILGSADEPEKLSKALKCNKEQIGQLLAQDCVNETQTTWNHSMLAHNVGELQRLLSNVRPFLIQK